MKYIQTVNMIFGEIWYWIRFYFSINKKKSQITEDNHFDIFQVEVNEFAKLFQYLILELKKIFDGWDAFKCINW
jgi:hypothetical protein